MKISRPVGRLLVSAALLSLLSSCAFLGFGPKWTTLFDGKSFTGWKQLQGQAKFQVRDGVIVGTVTPGVDLNSFLATEDDTYGDFIFECEFRADAGINSGVQFRSRPADEKFKRVHGYQCEIDPTPRGLTAGIYEEGGRGWFVPTANKGAPAEAFAKAHAGVLKAGEWNALRIEARGTHLRTWLNGVPMSDYEDTAEARIPRGFIALQIHQTKDVKLHGKEVAFRHLRVQRLNK